MARATRWTPAPARASPAVSFLTRRVPRVWTTLSISLCPAAAGRLGPSQPASESLSKKSFFFLPTRPALAPACSAAWPRAPPGTRGRPGPAGRAARPGPRRPRPGRGASARGRRPGPWAAGPAPRPAGRGSPPRPLLAAAPPVTSAPRRPSSQRCLPASRRFSGPAAILWAQQRAGRGGVGARAGRPPRAPRPAPRAAPRHTPGSGWHLGREKQG